MFDFLLITIATKNVLLIAARSRKSLKLYEVFLAVGVQYQHVYVDQVLRTLFVIIVYLLLVNEIEYCLNLVEKYVLEIHRRTGVVSMNAKRSGVTVAASDSDPRAIGESNGQSPIDTEKSDTITIEKKNLIAEKQDRDTSMAEEQNKTG
ncbi:unnamed protein product [Adineta ricciae]|uniref:Uncharacterized protein n=1 Tax=Adineta ricciae TaxID=249248 RepID=A0A815B5V9_ADIRI|nr:unnamed protein product [Adineta ricciae]